MSEERTAPADDAAASPSATSATSTAGYPRQAGRHDLDPCGRAWSSACSQREGRPCRHARSAGHRPAADRARRGDQDGAVRDGRPQDLSLHGALGRGARHRRRRRPRHRQQRRRGRRRRRSARCCRASPARSSRCRRTIPPSRSTASAPTISPATARRWSWRRARSTSTGSSWSRRPDADHTVLAAECGKGTYVRALARDLGRALGCYGHVSALRRTARRPVSAKRTRSGLRLAGSCAGRRRRRTAAWRAAAAGRRRLAVAPGARASAGPMPPASPAARRSCCAAAMPRSCRAGRGVDARRPDRAGRIRTGRAAAAAHLQSRSSG